MTQKYQCQGCGKIYERENAPRGRTPPCHCGSSTKIVGVTHFQKNKHPPDEIETEDRIYTVFSKEELSILFDHLVAMFLKTICDFGPYLIPYDNFKGVALEGYLYVCMRRMGKTEEEIEWVRGSHKSGREMMDYSVKSFTKKRDQYSYSGERTQGKKKNPYDTIKKKSAYLNSIKYSQMLMVRVFEEKGKVLAEMMVFSRDLLKTVDGDWDEKGWKTKPEKKGIGIKIYVSNSHQAWYFFSEGSVELFFHEVREIK